eukprot:scaffold340782_cov43-Prasinocladus_malaysianus.AAC.1
MQNLTLCVYVRGSINYAKLGLNGTVTIVQHTAFCQQLPLCARDRNATRSIDKRDEIIYPSSTSVSRIGVYVEQA